MIQLPKETNYIEAFLTFRCPLHCSYCINRVDGTLVDRKEIRPEEWIVGLNRIDFGQIPLTLGGGEPTLYKGFYKLLDGLRPEINVDLLTNLKFDIGEFVERTNPARFTSSITHFSTAYRSIRASYHPQQMDPYETIEKATQLQDEGFNIGIFALNHPSNLEANMEMSELARQVQVYFFIKDFLGWYNGQLSGHYKYPRALDFEPKDALCRTKDILIGPDGNIHRCHRDLYHGENPRGYIAQVGHTEDGYLYPTPLKFDYKFRSCKNYGQCNPCDVKLKTNRFLQMGNCQAEIIEPWEIE